MRELVLQKLDRLIPNDRLAEARKLVASSRIADLTESGRVVHAEMEALTACARIGSSTIGCSMFVTTFPSHNCAKHIVAAGIERVIVVEPYPKSLAPSRHDDSIAIDEEQATGKVRFLPFVGVAARRYFDLWTPDEVQEGPPSRAVGTAHGPAALAHVTVGLDRTRREGDRRIQRCDGSD